MKTPAAILRKQKQPLELDEVEVPDPEHGQVLVDIKVSRICGSQIGEIDGVKGPDNWLPHLLGHEAGAVVLKVGEGVTTVKEGDHVVLHWRPSDGIQSQAPTYLCKGETINAGPITTFNHQGIVSENRCTAIDPSVDWETAALMADTFTTGFGVINNDAGVREGESVVLIGCGGIGLGIVVAARVAGANPIIVCDKVAHKLEKAREYGATHTIHATDGAFSDGVRDILGKDPDVVIDGTGHPRVIEEAYELTDAKGRCILVGVLPHDQRVSIHTLPLHHGKILTGSEGGQSQPHLDIPRLLKMIDDGVFDPSGFVSHRGKLADVNDLIGQMRAGEVIHAMMHYE